MVNALLKVCCIAQQSNMKTKITLNYKKVFTKQLLKNARQNIKTILTSKLTPFIDY